MKAENAREQVAAAEMQRVDLSAMNVEFENTIESYKSHDLIMLLNKLLVREELVGPFFA